MYFVVGSGPSGIACAHALTRLGRPVTVLDTGLTLEPERELSRASLASLDKSKWPKAEVDLLTGSYSEEKKFVKLAFGSDFPYRTVSSSTEVTAARLGLRASYAKGGLSNVWGGAVLPYRQADLVGWPITEAELANGYAEVFKFLPLAGRLDPLAELFPLYTNQYTPLPQSRQTIRLMRSLERNAAELNARHVFFGSSRLAVDASGLREKSPCIVCGMCLHGCPQELIYSSRQSLEDLEVSGKVSYVRGVVVTRIEEAEGSVRIHASSLDGAPCSFEGERVFLAAGVLNSTTIVLRSLKLYDNPINMLDSQGYLFPMLQATAVPGVAQEDLHTLCQSFIEIRDADVSPHTVHLQIYTYNDGLAEILRDKLGTLANIFPTNTILGRLLIVKGYLHSLQSGKIVATLRQRGSTDLLNLEPIINPATKNIVKRVVRKIRSVTALTSSYPVAALLDIGEPGGSFHSGGSFPMAHAPNPKQTDRMGRPHGMKRTHIVDSTVFPSIPATTITLTAMANAYRIGREVAMADDGSAP